VPTYFRVSAQGGSAIYRARLKRGVDIAGALVLLILFGPLMVWIAIAIKIDSSGPVMFRQTRIGRGGRNFQILKFRTMVVGAHDHWHALAQAYGIDGLFKLADDPRITRVGHFLRRHALDELPQLWNVVRGDMSLVGPRPLVVEEERMIAAPKRGMRRLTTPGLTGPWQVLAGERVPLDEMLALEDRYVRGWSLRTDLKLLLLTVPFVVRGAGL
jgi:lipopolysaccharide/colanic/teichoic acid biosynthesis glycosyltransferase